jgi:hypothetical protein
MDEREERAFFPERAGARQNGGGGDRSLDRSIVVLWFVPPGGKHADRRTLSDTSLSSALGAMVPWLAPGRERKWKTRVVHTQQRRASERGTLSPVSEERRAGVVVLSEAKVVRVERGA